MNYAIKEFQIRNWLTLNQVPAELQKAVAELNQDGSNIRRLVKTSKGFVL